MAVVRPLRALRYNTERLPDLSPVLAPPYDVIAPQEQQALYARDMRNVIRLEYGLTTPEDSETDNRYTRARATLEAWLSDATLVTEARPAFYPHVQRYAWGGATVERQGVFAAVELQPFDQGDVLPHEWTLKGPKVDRLQLMLTCQACFSPVFGLYDGLHTDIGDLLAQGRAGAPLAIAAGNGFDERLWRLDDPASCAALTTAMSKRQILIADGHHRYETMLALRDLLRERYPDAPATAPFNYVLMELVDIHDPGLLVLATHRMMITTPEMLANFCKVACHAFHVEHIAMAQPDDVTELLARYREMHAFVWYSQGKYQLLTAPKTELNGLPVLDVTALQEQLVAPLLALDPAGEATVERNLRYTIHPADAVARVDCGEMGGVFFLNPTPVPDVLRLAAHGIRLPQKSTFFSPKLPTGLVMQGLSPELPIG